MKIRSLELQNFRKFTKPMRLTGLGDGINVLAECNEFGKSTVLAAIRGVLFERHTSKAKGVAEMRHWTHTTSPQVLLEFERDGGVYRIEKRFLHKEPFARLHMRDGSFHEGDVAEEKLQQLLGFRKAGNQGHKPEDAGMWGALWVTQLQATRLPELPEYARQTIHGCLEAQLGTITGGLRGKGFLQTVERDLAKLLNGNGKPTGSYKQVLEAHAKAAERMAQLEATRDELKENIDALEKTRQRLQALETAMRADVTEIIIAEAREKKAAAQLFEKEELLAQNDRKLTEGRIAELRRQLSERLARKSALEVARKRRQAATEGEARAAELLARAEGALAGVQTRLEQASEAADAAAQAVRQARSASDLAALFAALEKLELRLAAADQAQDKASTAALEVSRYRVTEPAVQAAEELSRSLDSTRTSLDAQATQVIFDLLPGAESQVQIDGAPASGLTPANTVSLIRDAVVEIAGIGTIQIRPAIKDRTSVLAQLGESERQMRTALVSMGVESLKQAREHLAARIRAERERERHVAEVRSQTPADAASGLASGLDALRNQIALVRLRSQADVEALGLSEVPTVEATRQAARLADVAERDAKEALTIAKAPLPVLQKQARTALVIHSEAAVEVTSAAQQAELLAEEMARETAAIADDRLAAEQAEALNTLGAQQAKLEAMQATRPVDTVTLMDARIARYESKNTEDRDERGRLLSKIAVLQSSVERDGGLSLDEELNSTSRQVEGFASERSRLEREVRILNLLKQELSNAERAAKERYMAPLVQRITPYLQTLFPGAAIHVDEDFQVTGVIRELQQREEFGGLSWGTQEQIAVLTRVAFADMLLDTGKPAMLILDDALAYADPDRLERMFDLLTHASSRLQILVLTCRGELFTRLGGRRVELISHTK